MNNWTMNVFYLRLSNSWSYVKGSVCYKTHGKKIPGQKTPRIKNNKAKLDIKHYCKIGHKTLFKKTL